jgi:RNA polymerase sigma factor (sigma-70 family)
VEVKGTIGMGAQRWIDLKFFKLQPSELMKIALVLVLAKYFHSSSLQSIETMRGLVVPIILTMFPAFLVMTQPDLGTALMLIMSAGAIFFVVGVQIWKFVTVGIAGLVFIPFAWHFLHDYQKNRVLTFLDPERDPLGSGYHIIQSKIAIGSGNIFNAFAKKYITTAILNAFNPLRHKVDTLQTVSIDAPVSGSRGEWADKDTTIGDSIPDENSTLPWESGQSEDEERALLKDWLKRLPETEAKAIEMYFPANNEDKKTLEEIGAELKMTKMGVKKLIDRVVNKLKQFAKEEGIVDSDK